MNLMTSGIFDENFYLSQNPDVAAAVAQGVLPNGLEHFLQFGASEGRDASASFKGLFNEVVYLAQNPDVAAAVAQGVFRNGLEHFLQFGIDEGRNPSGLFNNNFYLSQNPDVAVAVAQGVFRNGLEHFLQFGIDEGRNPSGLFNNNFYLSQNPDVAAAVAQGVFPNAFEHFSNFGQAEGRDGSPTGFNIRFDYRFDTNGFFADPARRAALETAANVWESLIQDEFSNVPAGIDLQVQNPQTGESETVFIDSEIDDLLIFVGAKPLGSNGPKRILAEADVGDNLTFSNVFHVRTNAPNASNFEPWVGHISFDPFISWFYDSTPNSSTDIPDFSVDFISLAMHEIQHVLGIGTSSIFEEIGAGGFFDGPNSLMVNNGAPIPLDSVLAHPDQSFVVDGRSPVISPTYTSGREVPTRADLAILADIGYQISSFQTQGSTPLFATDDSDPVIEGTIVDDVINALGGNDYITANAGNDTLLGGAGADTILGGPGDDWLDGGTGNDNLDGELGRDRFVFNTASGRDTVQDFTVADDTIQIAAGLGFSNGTDVFNAIQKRNDYILGPISEIALGGDHRIIIAHDAPLTPLDFVVA
ncbi:hypothetical protein NDA01_11395 [Trichocoleus desertorum AS-A10]|uniref:hypothetical protein n=1 Tax=Trichocoleus desertorum TaxID=1481672 RepID=UPI003297DD65